MHNLFFFFNKIVDNLWMGSTPKSHKHRILYSYIFEPTDLDTREENQISALTFLHSSVFLNKKDSFLYLLYVCTFKSNASEQKALENSHPFMTGCSAEVLTTSSLTATAS